MQYIKEQTQSHQFYRRFLVAMLLILGVFFLIIVRLWYLQLYRGEEFRQLSLNNGFKVVRILAPRGMMLDRNNKILVDNEPAYRLTLTRQYVQGGIDELISTSADLIGLDPSEMEEKIAQAKGLPAFYPITIVDDLDWKEVSRAMTNSLRLSGLEVDPYPRRIYLYKELGAHLFGYLGQIDRETLRRFRGQGVLQYRPGDYVGQFGIEEKWEPVLRGRDGAQQMVVDSAGRIIDENFMGWEFVVEEPQPGKNLVLTIDLDLQKEALKAFPKHRAGAVIVQDPKTGQILAMQDFPSFNPDIFIEGLSEQDWHLLRTKRGHPLEDKALRGQYPPGSVYKMVVAAAGLEEGVITPKTRFNCTGKMRYGRRSFGCWKHKGHGWVNLEEAIAQSCDVYFYRLGEKLGVDTIAEYAKLFGFGQRTGIGLNGEKKGLVPTTEWKKRVYGTKWAGGETLIISIGQGFNLETPIQIASYMSSLVNGGILYRPQVVKSINTPEGEVITETQPEIIRQLNFKPETLELIMKGMNDAVNNYMGTAYYTARLPNIKIGGKTGTAQVVRSGKYRSDSRFEDHAWFAAYAPADDPEIVVVVLVEHGGHGGVAAAPVAKAIIKKYFELKEKRKDLEEKKIEVDKG